MVNTILEKKEEWLTSLTLLHSRHRHDGKRESTLELREEKGKINGVPGETGEHRLAENTLTTADQGAVAFSRRDCHTHLPKGILCNLRGISPLSPLFLENCPTSAARDLCTSAV